MSSDGPEFNLLFFGSDGSAARQGHVASAVNYADRVSEADLLSRELEQIVADVMADRFVEVPKLKRDEIVFERKDRKVRRPNLWGDTVEQSIVAFYFEVPFSGDGDIFSLKPMTYDFNPPRGQVRGDRLIVSVEGTEDPARVQQEVTSTLDDVDRYLGWHLQLWEGVNEETTAQVRARLSSRKARIDQLKSAESGLEKFGFKPKG